MGFVLKWLSGPIGIWIVVAIAVSIFGLSLTTYAQYQRAERYQGERDGLRNERDRISRERDGLLTTIASKDSTIDELRKGLSVWEARADESVAQSQAAGDRATAYQRELVGAQRRIRQLTENDNDKPDCNALLEIDIAAVCPGLAAGVREWSNRSESGPDH